MIHNFILFVMICMLVAQISCAVYMVWKRKGLFDVLYGYALWGCLPINLLNILNHSL